MSSVQDVSVEIVGSTSSPDVASGSTEEVVVVSESVKAKAKNTPKTAKTRKEVSRCACELPWCQAKEGNFRMSWIVRGSRGKDQKDQKARDKIFSRLRPNSKSMSLKSNVQFRWHHFRPESFSFNVKKNDWVLKNILDVKAVTSMMTPPPPGEQAEWKSSRWVLLTEKVTPRSTAERRLICEIASPTGKIIETGRRTLSAARAAKSDMEHAQIQAERKRRAEMDLALQRTVDAEAKLKRVMRDADVAKARHESAQQKANMLTVGFRQQVHSLNKKLSELMEENNYFKALSRRSQNEHHQGSCLENQSKDLRELNTRLHVRSLERQLAALKEKDARREAEHLTAKLAAPGEKDARREAEHLDDKLAASAARLEVRSLKNELEALKREIETQQRVVETAAKSINELKAENKSLQLNSVDLKNKNIKLKAEKAQLLSWYRQMSKPTSDEAGFQSIVGIEELGAEGGGQTANAKESLQMDNEAGNNAIVRLPRDFFKFYLIPVGLLPTVAFVAQAGLVALDGSNEVGNAAFDVAQTRATLDAIARDIVIILGLLVTSSFVVLQMFAANFLTHTISLFFRDRGVFLILAFICMSAIFCMVLDALTTEEFHISVAIRVAYTLRMLSLSITFPYFNFLVNFLSPESLINQVCRTAIDCLTNLGNLSSGARAAAPGLGTDLDAERDEVPVMSVASTQSFRETSRRFVAGAVFEKSQRTRELRILQHQVEWINAVELLTDIGLSTLKQKDKENANNAMLSLYTVACEYSQAKTAETLPKQWYDLSSTIRARPDFSSLSADALESMVSKRVWGEWKILRAYQLLLETSNILDLPNLCGLAAFYTRKVGELAAQKGHREVVELCIKFLNTYIAYLIYVKNVQVLSGVLNEYRELGVEIVRMDAFFYNMIKEIDDTLNDFQSQGSRLVKQSILLTRKSIRGHYGNAALSSTSLDPTTLSLQHGRRSRASASTRRPSVFGSVAERQSRRFSLESNGGIVAVAPSDGKGIGRGRLSSIFQKLGNNFASRPGDAEAQSAAHLRAMKAKFINQKLHYHRMLSTIASDLRQHLVASSDRNLGYIAETIAHDMGEICAEAYKNECDAHEAVVAVFLTLDDTQTEASQRQTHRGIRRAQVKLATYYLVGKDIDLAKEIHEDMDEEPAFRIRQIYRELVAMDTESFWEISFRSRNLDYLEPMYKEQLKTFFGWFENFNFEKANKTDTDLFDCAKVATNMGVDEDEDDDEEDGNDDAGIVGHASLGEATSYGKRRSDAEEVDEEEAAMISAEVSVSERSEARRRTRASIDIRRQSILIEGARRHSVFNVDTRHGVEEINKQINTLRWRLQLYGEDSLPRIFAGTAVYVACCAVVGYAMDLGISPGFVLASTADQERTNNILSGMAVASALLFVVLCVSSMIILQLVAARYKFHPDMLSFLRDPILYGILSQILLACMLCTTAMINTSASYIPTRTIRVIMVLITLNLVLLIVYFVRLFFILQPDSILNNIQRRTLHHVADAVDRSARLRSLRSMTSSSDVTGDAKKQRQQHKVVPGSPSSAGGAGGASSRERRDNSKGDRYAVPEISNKDRSLNAQQRRLETVRAEVWHHQFQAHEHIKRICDFAFACVHESDEANLTKAISMLLVIIKEYAAVKSQLPEEWFEVRGLLRRTSDFINFSAYRITRVTNQRVWFEWKVLAQYLLIFEECLKMGRVDACQAVCLKTGAIAKGFIRANETNAYRVAINFINTFMRRAINSKNNEIANKIVTQNQNLLQEIIFTKFDERTPPLIQEKWRALISDQGQYQKYYAQVAMVKGLGPIAEQVATALGHVCSVALEVDELVHIDMLELLLTVDDTADEDQDSLVGIRRAQAKLGLKYILTNNESFARMVASDFEVETHKRLKDIVDELLSTNRAEYWEVSENGVPSEFLSADEKMELPKFFRFIEEEKAAEEANNPTGASQAPSLAPYIEEAIQRHQLGAEGDFDFRPRTKSPDDASFGLRKRESTVLEEANQRSGGTMRRASFARRPLSMSKPNSMLVGSSSIAKRHSMMLGSSASSVLQAGFEETQLDDFLNAILDQVQGSLQVKELCCRLLVPICIAIMIASSLLALSLSGDSIAYPPEETLDSPTFEHKDVWSTAHDPKDTTLPAELVIRVFSVVIMCSLIALQKSASRVVRHVWMLFRSTRWVQCIWLLNLGAVTMAVWNTGLSVEVPRPSAALASLLLASVSIMTLYPYFSYFFVFLDEDRLLTHVVLQDLKMLGGMARCKTAHTVKDMLQLVRATQRVSDFASSTIRVKDKTNAYKSLTALFCLARCYANIKADLPPAFFDSFLEHPALKSLSDFSRLSPEYRQVISADRTWVEWKLLRHFLFLFQESIGHLDEACYRIVISTRELAESALRKGDLPLFDLCIKFINTFVRVALDRFHIRLVYNITFQYRKLAENIINGRLHCLRGSMKPGSYERFVSEIAFYLRHYALAAQAKGIGFVTELICHDLSVLCMTAIRRNAKCHDQLFGHFLRAFSRETQVGRRGIRRAQIKLAGYYITQKRRVFVDLLFEEILTEQHTDHIVRAYAELCAPEVSLDFWEVNERNYNIDHMVPAHHEAVGEFLQRFPSELRGRCIEFERRIHQRTNVKAAEATKSDLKAETSFGSKQNSLVAVFSGFSRDIVLRARQSEKHARRRQAREAKKHVSMKQMRTRMGSTRRTLADRQLSSLAFSKMPKGSKVVDTASGSTKERQMNASESMANASQKAWFIVVLLAAIALALTAVTLLLEGQRVDYIVRFIDDTEPEDRQQNLKTMAKASVVIFCIVLTPTLIMLQINSRHLLGVIAEQFFQDRRVSTLLTYYTIAAVYCMCAHYVASENYAPKIALLISGFIVASLVTFLFPYFAIVFEFLDPQGVIVRMLRRSMAVTVASKIDNQPTLDQIVANQTLLNKLLQQLTGFAGASLQDKDKNNFTNVVRILSAFVEFYLPLKIDLDPRWFEATGRHLRISQDFASLEPEQLLQMTEQRCWVEVKLLRQFLGLFNEALSSMQESCFLIAIETVKMGQLAIEVLDYQTIEVVIKMLNTYIRSCLNKRAIRAVYNTLHQYRQFAELLIVSSSGEHQVLNRFAISIAQYLRYYGSVAAAMHLDFIVQVIAFDLARICETAFALGFDNFKTNDRTLAELLALFDTLQPAQGEDESANSGIARRDAVCAEHATNVESIARACICLATLYLEMEDTHRAHIIIDKLNEACQPVLLQRARDKIERCTERDFWEANDRGSNFDYLPSSRRTKLLDLFLELHNGEERLRKRESALIATGEDALAPTPTPSRNESLMLSTFAQSEAKTASMPKWKSGVPSMSAISFARSAMMRKVNRIREARAQHEEAQAKIEIAAEDAMVKEEDLAALASFDEAGDQVENDRRSSKQRGSVLAMTRAMKKRHHSSGVRGDGGKSSGNAWSRSIFTIPLAALSLLALSVCLQCIVGECPSYDEDSTTEGRLQAETMRTIALTMITFLGSVTTVSTIVLQIVSTRYTPRVAILFLRNFRIALSLTIFFGSTLFALLQAMQSSSAHLKELEHHVGYPLSLVLMALSFIILMPYIAHLLKFLDAAHIFREIGHEGLELSLSDVRETLALAKKTASSGDSQTNTKGRLASLSRRRVAPVHVTSGVANFAGNKPGECRSLDSDAIEAPAEDVLKSEDQIDPQSTDQLVDQQARQQRQRGVLNAIDQISDFALTALRLKDKHNAFHGIDLLCGFAAAFIHGKKEIIPEPCAELGLVPVTTAVNRDPDFVSMSDAILRDLEKTLNWVLWKALRQLLKMYELSLGKFNDAILRIARGLRHIGQAAAASDDLEAAQLCVKFMNTILQLALSQENQRAADTVLIQYRFMCENILTQRVVGEKVVTEDDEELTPWPSLICDIVGYLHHYALTCLSRLKTMSGRIIHDLCSLAAFARHFELTDIKNYIHEEIFHFLTECPVPPSEGAVPDAEKVNFLPRAVLRAYFKLASIYMSEFGDSVINVGGDVRKIKVALRKLDAEILEEIWKDFRSLSFKEDIQVSDRAVNVDALTTKQAAAVSAFLRSFQIDVSTIESGADVMARNVEMVEDESARSNMAEALSEALGTETQSRDQGNAEFAPENGVAQDLDVESSLPLPEENDINIDSKEPTASDHPANDLEAAALVNESDRSGDGIPGNIEE
ncbi:Hypothetical Protein FCC1311_071682 [Hondaea fermentalgiana]|uniref:Uncharacterized protein n=1 Tax=Hondaea fermentalgiana TaxID=2315210 RepID=A0A2R5GJ82_9STRA|nr:Hypothetical Protein FCC1311_071682 [Hondaea fermentalgiana]|eukprot:GBG30947.1 Hypothetical Protein FCC1311_071682 [Hondaea fermentalgiana]